jgi:hypothetical protein
MGGYLVITNYPSYGMPGAATFRYVILSGKLHSTLYDREWGNSFKVR